MRSKLSAVFSSKRMPHSAPSVEPLLDEKKDIKKLKTVKDKSKSTREEVVAPVHQVAVSLAVADSIVAASVEEEAPVVAGKRETRARSTKPLADAPKKQKK